MKDSFIGSLRTLFDWLDKINDINSDDTGHIYLFRGHPNKDYSLIPSVYRRPEWRDNEDQIIRQMLLRCPNEFKEMGSAFEKLVKMQHYNLPTRLLDLTENPLVALYFACVGSSPEDVNADGEILIFKIPKTFVKYFDSDVVSVLANVAWSPHNFEVHETFAASSQRWHDTHNSHASKLMHDIRREKPHFAECIDPKDIQKVVCVKPIIDNQRLARQDGLFFLFGINEKKSRPAQVPSDWLYRPNDKKLIISRTDKEKILGQLQKIGVSKAKLFPEIDMVSEFIKENPELEPIEFKSSIVKSRSGIVLPKR